uniref:RING-type E3 ubiquitin transferase n=1 Tax=Leersia perrieri TaxID=77586 RepID=A0A0D9VE93_9ORYZ
MSVQEDGCYQWSCDFAVAHALFACGLITAPVAVLHLVRAPRSDRAIFFAVVSAILAAASLVLCFRFYAGLKRPPWPRRRAARLDQQQPSVTVMAVAAGGEVERVPSYVHRDGDGEAECAVCLGEVEVGEAVLALAVIPITIIAGVLMYVAGVRWGIALLFLLVVILAVHWSHRRRSAAAATPAVHDDQQPTTAVAPSTVVVVVAPPPPPLRPPRAAQPSAPPVAEDDHVALLAAYAYEKRKGGDGEECAVCLGEMRQGEAAKRLPACLHVFHEGCIDMWLGSHDTCPICRSPVDAGAGDVAARVPVLVPSC